MKTKTERTPAKRNRKARKLVGSGQGSGLAKSPSTIRRELRALRHFIDNSPDHLAARIAYESEQVVRWLTGKTVGWPDLVSSAQATARLIENEKEDGYERLGSGDMFGALEAQLSPHAKHALETHTIAFFREGQEMTVGELRAAVRNLYGGAVHDELERHFEARRQAVLPRSPNNEVCNEPANGEIKP